MICQSSTVLFITLLALASSKMIFMNQPYNCDSLIQNTTGAIGILKDLTGISTSTSLFAFNSSAILKFGRNDFKFIAKGGVLQPVNDSFTVTITLFEYRVQSLVDIYNLGRNKDISRNLTNADNCMKNVIRDMFGRQTQTTPLNPVIDAMGSDLAQEYLAPYCNFNADVTFRLNAKFAHRQYSTCISFDTKCVKE